MNLRNLSVLTHTQFIWIVTIFIITMATLLFEIITGFIECSRKYNENALFKHDKLIHGISLTIILCGILFTLLMLPKQDYSENKTSQYKDRITKISYIHTPTKTVSDVTIYKLVNGDGNVEHQQKINHKRYNYAVVVNKANGKLIKTDD